jgi:Na+-driven multidrug efflux pump
MLPLALSRMLGGDLKGRGRPGLVSLSTGLALVITVIGDLALIPRLGIDGAAVASLLAYTAGAAVLVVSFARVTGASPLQLVPGVRDAVALAARGRSLLAGIQAQGRGGS